MGATVLHSGKRRRFSEARQSNGHVPIALPRPEDHRDGLASEVRGVRVIVHRQSVRCAGAETGVDCVCAPPS